MGEFAHFRSEPEALRDKGLTRLKLKMAAEELELRYGFTPVLCGSALDCREPSDYDLRVVVPNHHFDSEPAGAWVREAAERTLAQRRLYRIPLDVRIFPVRIWYRSHSWRLDLEDSPCESDPPSAAADDNEDMVGEAKRLIERSKDDPKFHVLMGDLLFMRGDKHTALQAFLRAVEIDPGFAGAWLNMGNVFYDWGEFRKAAIYYRRALALDPLYDKAYVNLANALAQLGFHSPALTFYDKALEMRPDLAQGHHNRGNCLTALKRYAEAEDALWRALELDSSDARIVNTLGNLRASQGEDYAAASAYKTALAMMPDYAPLHTNLANVYVNIGRATEAIVHYERGLVLEPHNPGVRYNLALAYLRQGQYRLGWKAYESRWEFRELATKKRDFTEPQWKGEALNGRRILIHAEQGLGDTIQFCRYIPLVARLDAVVYFEVQHRLQRLMANLDGVRLVCTRGMTLPEFDLHCPLMSMPAIFKTEVETVPCPIPYLRAWQWEVEEVWRCWPETSGRIRVGISWAGNPRYKKDRDRSFSLSEFAPLADLESLRLFSLQAGPAAAQIAKYPHIPVIDASSRARDFAETAALISTLDLVIASDSSPMHLAAAMGKEVWLLLSYIPDWRWMDFGKRTHWYPNVRIFRQSSPGDWPEVFARVRAALRDKLAARAAEVVECES